MPVRLNMPPTDRPARGRAHAVLHGTLRLLSGQLAAKAIDMAVYLLLARRLGVEAFGVFTYALSFTLLFNVLTDLGLSTVFTREAARVPGSANMLLRRVLGVKLLLAPATWVVVLGAAWAAHTSSSTLVLIGLLTASMLLGSLASVHEGLLRAAGHPGRVGLSLMAASLTSLAVVGVASFTHLSVFVAASAQLCAQLVHVLAAALATRGLPPVSAGIEPLPSRRAMLREALPVALSGVFIALYFRIDAVMLHALRDEHAVGLYGGTYRVFEAFAMLTVGFRSVLFPHMARAADGPREALAVLARKSLRLQLVFTVLVGVTFTFLARPVLAALLGPAYAEAASGMAILIWALPGSFMADTLLHLLIAQRRQALGTWVVGATAILNVSLNFVLIPRWSYLGASAATVASECTCFVLLYTAFARGVPGVGLLRVAWRPFVAGAALAGALFALAPRLPAGVPGLALGLVTAAVTYGVVLLGLGELQPGDVALLRSLGARTAPAAVNGGTR